MQAHTVERCWGKTDSWNSFHSLCLPACFAALLASPLNKHQPPPLWCPLCSHTTMLFKIVHTYAMRLGYSLISTHLICATLCVLDHSTLQQTEDWRCRVCIFSPQSVSKTPTVIDYKLCSTKRDKILLCNAMQYLECFIKCKKRPGIVYWRRSSIPCVWIALCLTIFCFKYQLRCISRTLYYICTVLLYSHKGPSLCFLCIVFPCIVFWVSAKVSPSRVAPMHITPV